MSGSVSRVASGTYNIGSLVIPATRLSFVIDGPQGAATLPGVSTGYGWFAAWDSAKDGPGTYSIHTIAFDLNGSRRESAMVIVHVAPQSQKNEEP